MEKVISKIHGFLVKETKKRGFDSVVFGLSGGIDSAVVAYFCNAIFNNKARAFIMPSIATNPRNTQDAIRFAQSIGLYYEVIDISDVEQIFATRMMLENTKKDIRRRGNFCARTRMSILYDKSLFHNSLVIGTSNKSELVLGYGTIYGDLACAINPIGDIYKSDIFALAKTIGIPTYIINKKPSADLFIGQNDESDLGYTYEEIDTLLKQISKGLGRKELLQYGFDKVFVKSILKRIKQNAFKRKLPKVAKL